VNKVTALCSENSAQKIGRKSVEVLTLW